jgi:hypothetical protein
MFLSADGIENGTCNECEEHGLPVERSRMLRTILGGIYGGLLAFLAVIVIDILIAGSVPDFARKVLLYGGVAAGIAIGAWLGYRRSRKKPNA